MKRRCPICNSSEIELLSDKLRDTTDNNVLVCQVCDTGFLEDIKSQKDLEEFYKEDYRKTFTPNIDAQTNAKELFETYKNFQNERLQNLAPFFDHNKRLMEIGSSAGMFLTSVQDKFKEVIGVELDRDSAYYCRNLLNCEVCEQPIHKLPYEPKSFDIICAFQVLEHVSNPLEFINQVLYFLKDDGILYFEFPNRFDSLVSTYDLPFHSKFFYHSAHNYYYSQKGIKLILDKCNLEFEFIYSQDYNILNHISWIINDKPEGNCIPGLSTPKPPIKNGVMSHVENSISQFFEKIDLDYKSLLCDLKISSNMAFIAKRII